MKIISKIAVMIAGVVIFVLFFFIGASITQTTPRLILMATGINDWEYIPKEQSIIYYNDETEMERIGYKRLYSDEFPQFMKDAIVAVEDRRFYQHLGFDAKGIGRALWMNIQTGTKAEGGSTITQQLSRTVFLTQERTYTRKIKEIFIATALEEKFSKDEILNIYLNEIYMGRGSSGMGAAARYYFAKDVMDLNRAQITMLVGIIQAPEFYNPENNFEGVRSRQQTVINILVDDGILSEEEGKKIAVQDLNIIPRESIQTKHPYYMAYLTSILEKDIDNEQLHRGGLKIYTTINSQMQNTAETTVKNHANQIKNRGIDANDIALVSIDPRNGSIRAMVGGVDFSRSQINMAVRPRQPGSAIKPLYYAAAMEHLLIEPDSVVNNKETDFGDYRPVNYSAAAPEEVSIREALVRSHNVASVEILSKLGVNRAVSYLREMNITSIEEDDIHLALGLGGMTKGISPLQLTSAYTIFPNKGQLVKAYTIKRIEDEDGRQLYMHRNQSKNIIRSNTATQMDSLLRNVVDYGTGTAAQIPITSGGKTGTTTDSRDLWYVGYTSELVTSLWVGNTDNRAITGFGVSGGGVAAPIFRDYMNTLYWLNIFEERPSPVLPSEEAHEEEDEIIDIEDETEENEDEIEEAIEDEIEEELEDIEDELYDEFEDIEEEFEDIEDEINNEIEDEENQIDNEIENLVVL
ncbi:Multimodular transpeptidase-transglycosylase [Candidatus Syntrophocurvum alkaliphilum]|uniref:Penicillin-binding protein 1A n=1 Tax=Candidatus Syntrophocurvum alkaliphilum TaxID=2293317 RepID=A0A6I6DGJ4_9FIRM|nr:PBP1A family penicillin-binding protein [Candidatus Syntrophocurvum alkaliphilum]QGU00217.1 Multimodular transpeptidase-transglycosylase [Candidatus Syntrophocurvum alkaliphilum]